MEEATESPAFLTIKKGKIPVCAQCISKHETFLIGTFNWQQNLAKTIKCLKNLILFRVLSIYL